jgi:hypothetical protein
VGAGVHGPARCAAAAQILKPGTFPKEDIADERRDRGSEKFETTHGKREYYYKLSGTGGDYLSAPDA